MLIESSVSIGFDIDTRLIIGIGNGSENGNNPHFACP